LINGVMMDQSVVAVFDKREDAEKALDALLAEGFMSSDARITSAERSGGSLTAGTTSASRDDDSLGDKIARFFGFEDDYEETYSEAVRRGHYVLQVDATDEEDATRARNVIMLFDPVDIDERSAEWRQSGWMPGTSAGTAEGLAATGAGSGPTDQGAIPIAEERLEVGKREVQTGGVRVVSRVVRKPVEAEVSLREERATVTRHPVDRAVTDADRAFQEQSIEVRESAEEAVVGKTAHVVEEVRVGKETDARQETIRDTVRKTEVDVEQIGDDRAGTAGRGGALRSVAYTGPERRRPGNFVYNGPERRAA
jgi:uncharacterized protein (TIGR02271 family)